MTTGQVLADQIEKTREWTLMLLSDIDGDDWTVQLQPGMQHALWICGHLACAQGALLFQRCLGRSVLDAEFCGHFPIGAAIKSASEHDWPSPTRVRQEMDRIQQATLDTVATLDDETLTQPAFGKDGAKHPHYDTKLGAISHISRHEAFHAGQLATIRRLLGKPFLR